MKPTDRQLKKEDNWQEPLVIHLVAGGNPPPSAATAFSRTDPDIHQASCTRTVDERSSTASRLQYLRRIWDLAGRAAAQGARADGSRASSERDTTLLYKKRRRFALSVKELEDRVECSASPSASTLIGELQNPLVAPTYVDRLHVSTCIAI